AAGDQYDAAMRRRRLNNDRAEAAAARPPPSPYLTSFPASEGRFDFVKQTPRPEPTVTIGGRTYRGVDNGRANILVPVDDPRVSPTELVERRQAVSRALFMADHPLGSVAYSLAALANTSSRTRDGALVAGGLVDAAMSGSAPMGASIGSRATPPRARPAPPTMQRPNIRYGELNANGQATGVNATVTRPMLGSGTSANRRLTPPGWQGHGTRYNESRGHVQAKRLGGTGRDMRGLVTLTQNPTNSPQMSDFESMVARRVRGGEVVEYSATPLYAEGVLPPSSILLTAYGSRGAPVARILENPAGRRR
ncbi:MAG TPA: DNA/RNA non-specific endonuclease, partial [Phenylobacterium sp.]|nr:DNA/RNA non-specific endonuclease [Phenylobacterium sp.]